MVSQRVQTRIRIADGSLVIVLALVSVVMIWSQAPAALAGIAVSLAAVGALILGVTVLVGRSGSQRLVLTRRRWKYVLLLGALVVYFLAGFALGRTGGNPVLALFPALVGGFLAQLFEPESVAVFTMAALSDRNVRAWKRVVLVAALVGIFLGCVGVVGAVVGNLVLVSLLLPVAIIFLILAAVAWVRLRSR